MPHQIRKIAASGTIENAPESVLNQGGIVPIGEGRMVSVMPISTR